MKDLDSLTGFYLSDDTDFTRINTDYAKLEKYILKDGDIVFAYKGSKVTIGKVGYVNLELNK